MRAAIVTGTSNHAPVRRLDVQREVAEGGVLHTTNAGPAKWWNFLRHSVHKGS